VSNKRMAFSVKEARSKKRPVSLPPSVNSSASSIATIGRDERRATRISTGTAEQILGNLCSATSYETTQHFF
jgi:hypothetical protein